MADEPKEHPSPEEKRPALEKPQLKRLGDLQDLTQGMFGTAFDGGSGMSRA
jgi:hypothetical protein